jgi:hypothetical protein
MSPDAEADQAEFLRLYQAMNAYAQERILGIARALTEVCPAPKRAPRLKLVTSVAPSGQK